MSRHDEQTAGDDELLLATDPETEEDLEDDPELAAYHRDLPR